MQARGFQHILVPTDFGESAARALEVAILIATKFDADVTVLHVTYVPRATYDVPAVLPLDDYATEAQAAINAELERVRQRCPKCEGLVEAGTPAQRIVEVARERGADLIVMGTQGRRGISRMFLGSVADKVIRTSPLPVLTVSAEEDTRPA